ncbi:hypothetical protein M0H77_RS09975 [Providencia rettgeri]|nr:hypothetical protein [Providencia rettgeri]
MSPYISGFLIFLIISLFLGAFFSLLYTDRLKLNDESLDKQPLFWFAVVSPIVLFLIFGVIIWKDYIPDLSEAGLERFANISKFPLAVLALSPIFGVIVSNIHKSIQTEKQIEQSEIKGRIDSYLAHYKIITDRIMAIKERKTSSSSDKCIEINIFFHSSLNLVYKSAYPNSSLKNGYNGELVSDEYIEKIKNKIIDVSNHCILSLDDIKEMKKIEANIKNEKNKAKVKLLTREIMEVILPQNKKSCVNLLCLAIGLGREHKNYINPIDSDGNLKNINRIVNEYVGIYLKLYEYTIRFLQIFEVNDIVNIVKPYNKLITGINKSNNEYLKLVEKKLENLEKKDNIQ